MKTCSHCGRSSTPCWRRGPPDKPMLCNACGSRWLVKGTLEGYMPGSRASEKTHKKPVVTSSSAWATAPPPNSRKRSAAEAHLSDRSSVADLPVMTLVPALGALTQPQQAFAAAFSFPAYVLQPAVLPDVSPGVDHAVTSLQQEYQQHVSSSSGVSQGYDTGAHQTQVAGSVAHSMAGATHQDMLAAAANVLGPRPAEPYAAVPAVRRARKQARPVSCV